MSVLEVDTASDPWTDLNIDDAELQRLLDAPCVPPSDGTRLRTNGFDDNAGNSWIYPTNLPERAYQLSIAHAALFRNTLVVLPTGLGKTFIAAVVMYNIYRWYPTGKVLFMAPTRPLVAQQISACQLIMPFPAQDMVELTGKLKRARRTELWRSKRVFFATPQVVQSDIMNATETDFPFAQIRLIVIDEAHKAKGRYAYTEVAKAIWQSNRDFRVLALSATPGRTTEDVAEVVRNLFISHLEVRWDSSIDVQMYVHKRSMRTIVVPLGEDIKAVREELMQIIDPYLRQLVDAGVLHTALNNINRNLLLYEQKRFREHTQQQRHPQQVAINSNFSICISLCHSLELLERHGMRVFLNNFEDDEDGRSKFVLNMEHKLRELVERLRAQVGPNPFDVSAHVMTNGELVQMPEDLDFGHPKFEEARKCVLKHFEAHADSRAIVFCEYRESVMLIYRLLLQHVPMLKPRCFVGQGGTTGTLRALTQKQQIQIMQDFRSGKSNILVATSIGEEGIDVGEVDLIVCFDISTSNPTRFVQRIGRTGRQKQGNVVMLVTEGREQRLLKDALAQKDQTNKKLLQSSVVKSALYQHAPRLVPTEFNPQCIRTFVRPPEIQTEKSRDSDSAQAQQQSSKPTKKKISSPKNAKNQPIKGSQDLRKFFKQSTAVTLDADELEIFEAPNLETSHTAERSLNSIDKLFKTLDVTENPGCSTKTPADVNSAERLERGRWVDKILQSGKPLLAESERIYDFHEQLKVKNFSNSSKRILLKSRPEFVRETCEQMDVLGAIAEEADTSMSVEEHELRENYALIETICGGSRAGIHQLLAELEEEQLKRKNVVTTEPDWNELVNSSSDDDDQLEALIDKLFEGLGDRGMLCDNFDYIQQELKKTQRYKDIMAEKTAPMVEQSMVYETVNELELSQYSNEDCTITDSKYCSQWDDFVKRDLPNKSTPMQKGPLARSFQRQQQKQQLTNTNLLYSLKESTEKGHNETNNDESLQKRPSNQQPTSSFNVGHIDSSTFDSLEQSKEQKKTIKEPEVAPQVNITNAADQKTPTHCKEAEVMLNELDFDLDAFFEPFPEEESLKAGSATDQQTLKGSATSTALPTKTSVSTNATTTLKEHRNINKSNNSLANLAVDAVRQSPDIFEETLISPLKLHAKAVVNNKKETLSAELTTKRAADICPEAPTVMPAPHTPPKSLTPVAAIKVKSPTFAPPITSPSLASPKRQPINTNMQQYKKSPSIFDLYLKNMRGRAVATLKSDVIISTPTELDKDESVIIRQPRAAKRKIIDSDSSDNELTEVNAKDKVPSKAASVTDPEEIKASQQPPVRTFHQRKKRHRRNPFLQQEAAVSGSDSSADEFEHTADAIYDSIVALSGDEEEDNAASRTHMQAFYLQSLKSPQKRAGGFKIPAHRTYNDHSHIFSQAVPVENSQYLPDSFVVEEVEAHQEADVSLCPLERAERILKQRRRARKAQKELYRITDDYSSGDEFM